MGRRQYHLHLMGLRGAQVVSNASCALVLVVCACARARGVLVLVPCSWYACVFMLVVCARTRVRGVLAMVVCLFDWLGGFCLLGRLLA